MLIWNILKIRNMSENSSVALYVNIKIEINLSYLFKETMLTQIRKYLVTQQ